MSFHHRENHKPTYSGTTGAAGGATTTTTPTTPAAAQTAVTDGTDAVTAQYNAIFQQQMTQQAQLYGAITQLNDLKNAQSSYLSLAKSVSEMV